MKRTLLLALAVVAAVTLAVELLVQARHRRTSTPGIARDGRAFVSDSLGVSLRLPDTPGWTLRREPAAPGGPVLTAVHESKKATLRLFVSTLGETRDLETVLQKRQAQVAASVFGVHDLKEVVTEVIRNEKKELDGYPALQWQALTEPIQSPGEPPSRVEFLWEIAQRPPRVFECLGLVRFENSPKEEDKAVAESLLQDVAFILQSVQLR